MRGRRRIIPARAGFTSSTVPARRPPGDHPRSRGVYARTRRIPVTSRGSSPLARGLPGVNMRVILGQGIIPARAGFTLFLSVWGLDATGSSPLARGLPTPHSQTATRPRIIPARAGFTSTWARVAMMHADHPRSRGVYSAGDGGVFSLGGSSPLARGLRRGGMGGLDRFGIIPARAGFTRRPW